MVNWIVKILGVRPRNRPAYRAILRALIFVIILVAVFVGTQVVHAANGKLVSFYMHDMNTAKDRGWGITYLSLIGVDTSIRSKSWEETFDSPQSSVLVANRLWKEGYSIHAKWIRSDGRWGECTFFVEPSQSDQIQVGIDWYSNRCWLKP